MKEGKKEVYATANNFDEHAVYYPDIRPGYTAWASLFQFGNGDLGLAFNEIREGKNSGYTPLPLEFAEAMLLPYRFLPVGLPACNPELISEYVTMKSTDGGKSWQQTGRCQVSTRHYWNVGFPDGRLVRLISTQHYRYELSPDDRMCSIVEESLDGGNTWREISRFLQGKFFYGHKFKKLRNGSIIAAGPVEWSFGPGGMRPNRHTVISGEVKPVQSCFMISEDGGYTWDGPHYILSGIESWEPDFVELQDGSLLFINSTIQAGRAVRQIVRRTATGWENEPLMEIHRGAPGKGQNVQGGITPETVTITPDGLIVGVRRGGSYTCSNDLGENWYEIEGPENCNYQPMIEYLPDGKFLTVWHYGTDSALGEFDMYIGTHEFTLTADLPIPASLAITRELSDDKSHYINAYSVKFTAGENAVSNREIALYVKDLRPFDPVSGTHKTSSVDIWESSDVRTAVTDSQGIARFYLTDKDRIPDMHHSYSVAAGFMPKPGDPYAACKSIIYGAYTLTPKRGDPAPYPVYNNHGTIMLTPEAAEQFPDLPDIVKHFCVPDPSAYIDAWIEAAGSEERAEEVLDFLMKYNIVRRDGEGLYHWYRTVHSTSGVGEPYIHGSDVCHAKEFCV